jgi:diguanylate cyclase (GGDEF)-like protein
MASVKGPYKLTQSALLAALWLCLAAPLPGANDPFQDARLAMRIAGVEDGLPSPRVHCVFLDKKNRLWVGTPEGAAFLGGSGWTYFPLPQEAPSIYIRAMAETQDGCLWFGTEAGGLWSCAGGKWRHWTVDAGLPVPRVNVLLAAGNDLWVGTGGGGLLRRNGDRFEPVRGPSDPWIWALAAIPDDSGKLRMWVGGEHQVWMEGAEGWQKLRTKKGFWEAGANAIAYRQGPGGKLEVWLSAWKAGVARWLPERQSLEWPIPGAPSKSPTSLAVFREEGAEDEIWLGTYDAGLARFGSKGWQLLGPAQGFPSTGVYSLLSNPEKRPAIWAGTRGAGLVSVDLGGWRSLEGHHSLPSHQASCFLETRDESGRMILWMGTDRGLVRWDSSGIRIEGLEQGLPSSYITDIQEFQGARGPEIWVGTLGGVARKNGDRWEVPGEKDKLNFYRVQCLAADRDEAGSLRIYAAGDGGVARFESGRWQMLEGNGQLPKNVIVTSLRSVKDLDGGYSLWVGMRGGGVARLKNRTWKLFGAREGLNDLSVYGLASCTAPSGKRWLWAAMLGGGGLARIDVDLPDSGFRTWGSGQIPGFPPRGIQRIVVNPQGYLFLTTSRGVVRLDLKGPDWDPDRAMTFGTGDGLPSAVSETGALYLDSANRVWVGTAKGMAVLDPSLDHPLVPPDPPIIEKILVQGRPVESMSHIRLTWKDQHLQVNFGLPEFFRHEAVLYRTQLIGLELEPLEWSPRADRELTTLPAGDYTLRIWGRDGIGRESPPVELQITVIPPIWHNGWVIAILVVACLGSLVGIMRWRHRVLELRAQELEKIVETRTGELAQAISALRIQSATDPLTGLLNRRTVQQRINELIRALNNELKKNAGSTGGTKHNLGFFILDLDRFKSVNDAYGHEAGDKVLLQAAKLLETAVRGEDLLVRWGGEEFLILAVDSKIEDLSAMAERIRNRFEECIFDVGAGRTVRCTASLGFSTMPVVPNIPDAFSWEQVLSLADRCLYKAKEGGRNRWVGLIPATEPPKTEFPGLDLEWLIGEGWLEILESPARPRPEAPQS